MVNSMPAPVLLGFLANKTPHCVDFSHFHFVDLDEDLAWIQALEHDRVDVSEMRPLFLTQP
jgi:hypothetical protein